jgi:hypothetical protein
MRVSILGFGSVWRRRSGKDPEDPKRFSRAAYYNTTGVAVSRKFRPPDLAPQILSFHENKMIPKSVAEQAALG